VLPPAARLTRGEDFATVIRTGRKARRSLVVVHVLLPSVDQSSPETSAVPARAGFVVSKAVGGSVVRHRVSRRLRHLMRPRLGGLPAGTAVVVRALPAAAAADSCRLGSDLDGALCGALNGGGRR
jgi:ribonuclease P protein component